MCSATWDNSLAAAAAWNMWQVKLFACDKRRTNQRRRRKKRKQIETYRYSAFGCVWQWYRRKEWWRRWRWWHPSSFLKFNKFSCLYEFPARRAILPSGSVAPFNPTSLFSANISQLFHASTFRTILDSMLSLSFPFVHTLHYVFTHCKRDSKSEIGRQSGRESASYVCRRAQRFFDRHSFSVAGFVLSTSSSLLPLSFVFHSFILFCLNSGLQQRNSIVYLLFVVFVFRVLYSSCCKVVQFACTSPRCIFAVPRTRVLLLRHLYILDVTTLMLSWKDK